MKAQNLLILKKENSKYYCKIIDFFEKKDKLRLQLLSTRTFRNFNIFENDIVDIELTHDKQLCFFQSKVLYHDKINHLITLEKPTKAICDYLESVVNNQES